MDKQQAIKDIEYYNFYFRRYKIFEDKQRDCKHILKQRMLQFKLKLRERLGLNINTLDFLDESVMKVFECMSVLKWSYVFGYHINDEL